MYVKYIKRALLAIFILVLAITTHYIKDALLERQARAQSRTETHLPAPTVHTSLKARIEHRGPDGEIEWLLEADKMEFPFSESGGIAAIECSGSVIFSQGGSREWSLKSDRMDFTMDDTGDITIITFFGSVVFSQDGITLRSESGTYDMKQGKFTFDGKER